MSLHEEIIEIFNAWDTQPDEWFTSAIIAKVREHDFAQTDTQSLEQHDKEVIAKTIERVLVAVSKAMDEWPTKESALQAIKEVGNES